METYLYLNEQSHVDTWVNGGMIPLSLASAYRSDKRGGVMTPDENLIYDSPVDLRVYEPYFVVQDCKNFTAYGNVCDGVRMPDVFNVSRYFDDGLIWCCSTKLCGRIASRFKKRFCVRIPEVQQVKQAIDQSLQIESTASPCQYTQDHRRDHFLKSVDDMWQYEYRIFWPRSETLVEAGTKTKWVEIPPGLAVPVPIPKV